MVDIFVAKKKKVEKKPVMKEKVGLGAEYRTVAERLSDDKKNGKIRGLGVLPHKVRFETQEYKEKVILLLRQHWITQLKWMVTAVVMLLMPIGLIWIPLIDFMPGNFQLMAIVIWYLLLTAFIYEKFITWFFHVFIITDERVIDVDFYSLFYKEVSEAKIDNIEDVTYRQGGMMGSWFNYGDVLMQTAAEEQEFSIENVPQPDRVVKILNELKLEEEHEKIVGRVR